MTKVLVFGLSGQVGDALRSLLHDSLYEATAVSRTNKNHEKNITWVHGGFPDFNVSEKNYDAIISLGPLDGFVNWLASSGIKAKKIVVLSSTSIVTKKSSPDPKERQLALLLEQSEQLLIKHAEQTGASLMVLRPTLMYGAARDQSLSRWLSIARRFKLVVLPKNAAGLRQPVHVADVAYAVLKSLELESHGQIVLDLPGGEILPFDQMLLRSLKVNVPATKVVRIPNVLFRFLLAGASFMNVVGGVGPGFFARLREDWVFDAIPARTTLGYAPRPFSP